MKNKNPLQFASLQRFEKSRLDLQSMDTEDLIVEYLDLLALSQSISTSYEDLQSVLEGLEMQNQAMNDQQIKDGNLQTRYDRLFWFSPIAYCMLDENHVITACNRRFQKTFGRPEMALKGMPLMMFCCDQSRDQLSRRFFGGLDDTQIKSSQLLDFKHKDGHCLTLEVNFVELPFDETHSDRWLISMREPGKMLDNQYVSSLPLEVLMRLSHDLRVPMTDIMGLSQLLLISHLSAEQMDMLKRLYQSGRYLSMLLDNMLDMGKLMQDSFDECQVNFSLNLMLNEISRLFVAESSDRGIQFYCPLKPLSSDVELRGDVGRLRQILINLVAHAMKNTRQGEVSVDIDYDDKYLQTGRKLSLRVSVKDNGRGQAQKHLEALLANEQPLRSLPFLSGELAGYDTLQLIISAALLKQMGSALKIISHNFQGSEYSFQIALPVVSSLPLSWAEKPLQGNGLCLFLPNHAGHLAEQVLQQMQAKFINIYDPQRLLGDSKFTPEEFDWMVVDEALLAALSEDGFQHFSQKVAAIPLTVLITNPPYPLAANRQKDDVFSHHLPLALLSADLPALLLRESDSLQGPLNYFPSGLFKNRRAKILVVEDSEMNGRLMDMILHKLGCQVTVVHDGEQALAKIHSQSFDMVLMDIVMPGLDGIETLQLIRSDTSQSFDTAMPVIAMTANVSDDNISDYLDKGFNGYLLKPFEVEKVVSLLRNWLPRTGTFASEQKITAVSGIDKFRLLQNLQNDKQLMDEVLTLFFNEAPIMIDKIEALLVTRKKTRQLGVLVHRLKSMAVNIAAERLHGLLQKMEDYLQDQQLDLAIEVWSVLLEEMEFLNTSYQHPAQPVKD